MRRILLYTLVILAAPSFANEGLDVTFMGQSKFEVGIKKQDKNHDKSFFFSPNQKSTAILTNQKASIKVEGKKDSFTYGAVIRIATVGSGSDGMGSARNDRSHIYLDTDYGTLQLGSNFATSKLFQIDASNIASGASGIDGDWGKFASSYATNLNTSSSSTIRSAINTVLSYTVMGPNTISNRMDNNSESTRKITYLSPRISGLQFGLSFSPDLNNDGGNHYTRRFNYYLGNQVRAKNLWSTGINYTNMFNDVAVSFAIVGDRGEAVDNSTKLRNLKTFSVGGIVAKNGFSSALSYHKDGDSLTDQAMKGFNADWWTAGLAYEQGAFSTSLTYLNGKKGTKEENVKTSVISLGADYKIFAGLKAFAEVSYVQLKPNQTGAFMQNNQKLFDQSTAKATIFILGTKIKF